MRRKECRQLVSVGDPLAPKHMCHELLEEHSKLSLIPEGLGEANCTI